MRYLGRRSASSQNEVIRGRVTSSPLKTWAWPGSENSAMPWCPTVTEKAPLKTVSYESKVPLRCSSTKGRSEPPQRGKRMPHRQELVTLCARLNIDLEAFFGKEFVAELFFEQHLIEAAQGETGTVAAGGSF
jgi:hypothetical protein